MTGSIHVNKGKWYCVLNMKDENGRRKQKWFSTGIIRHSITNLFSIFQSE